MPELPDIALYVSSIATRVVGTPLVGVRLASPFLLRTVSPSLSELAGKRVVAISRLGKRIVFELAGDDFLVLHLMVAGRLRWRERGEKIPGKVGLAAFDFESGSMILTEAGSKRRASLHAVRGRDALAPFDRGGLNVLTSSYLDFATRLREENHTLKRSLTDPTILDGIGNAYSDEILWAAQLSPVKLTSKLSDEEMRRLYDATQATLTHWIDALAKEAKGAFPEKVTAFRPDMETHGRFGEPCRRCGTKIQRIKYADNETNYCPTCQTAGKLLADRGLSKLLHGDWPKTLDELENRKARLREP